MATAEKMFSLTVPRQSEGLSQSLASIASRVFGCWHRQLSRPFTRQGQTFRSCLSCGARRHFDLNKWETKGDFYRVAA